MLQERIKRNSYINLRESSLPGINTTNEISNPIYDEPTESVRDLVVFNEVNNKPDQYGFSNVSLGPVTMDSFRNPNAVFQTTADTHL